MRVLLDPAAAAELREAALFYEDCREGLVQAGTQAWGEVCEETYAYW